jgi:hypothetical protein
MCCVRRHTLTNTLNDVFGQYSVRQLYVVWTYGSRATQCGLVCQLWGYNCRVEGTSYLLKPIPIFPESGLEELQLTMQAFLVTHSPHPV